MTYDPADIAYCADQVSSRDPDRFATAMLADPERRAPLFALYAFNLEIARTRESVREMMLGRIRLQWWREALEECFDGTPRRHQVVQPLATAIRTLNLPREPFFAAVDGREQDIDDLPPPNEAALATYVEATGGAIGQLAAFMLGGEGDIGGRVGRAYAWVGLARALHAHRHAGRRLIPTDLLRQTPELDEDAERARFSPAVRDWTARLVALSEGELEGLPKTVKETRAAFAPAGLTRTYCKKLRKAGFDPFNPETVSLTPFARAGVLLRYSLLGR